MRGTPSRLADGGPAEPWGVVELTPPPVKPSASRNVEIGSPTRVEETVPLTTPATPSRAGAELTATPNVPMQQTTSSSSAIVSSGGEHSKRSADPTVEGAIPMSEVKRPRGRPITRVFVNALYSGVHGRMPRMQVRWLPSQRTVQHRAADSAASASHVGGAASRVGSAISIQTTSQAACGTAISSQVGGVSKQIQVATRAGVHAKAEPTAIHAGTASQETQLRAAHVGAAAVQVGAANETQ